MNLPGPKQLHSDATQKWLLSQEAKLTAAQHRIVRQRLDQISSPQRQLADLERATEEAIAAEPWLQERVQWLENIPALLASSPSPSGVETGELTRFHHPDELGAHAGLTPRVCPSADTVHPGHLSKMGPPLLRWVWQQAARVAVRVDAHARRLLAAPLPPRRHQTGDRRHRSQDSH